MNIASRVMADPNKLSVCVIGAGAAGLCAARHLATDSKFEFTVYEQTDRMGGTWVYKEQTGVDENGIPIHSSMYHNLRTNLPAKIMNFPDYMVMQAEQPGCITHQEVLSYLDNYTEHFQLRQYIKFNTQVQNVHVEMLAANHRERWTVRVKKLKTQEIEIDSFDAIMVCNGHYSLPYIPVLNGIESFPGLILHSHSYRTPNEFSEKTVLILGAASSGIDIAIDLANHATLVYLSHNNDRLTGILPSNVVQVMGVDKFEGNRVFLKDGISIEVDDFIYCTGYQYNFPFLDESCGICVDENYVTPLYKHLINIEHPTMCLVGIPTLVVPFSMFHVQVQYFLALLKGKTVLPSKVEMLEDSKLKTAKKRHAHKLMEQQWSYNDTLADAGGFSRLPVFYKIGYELWGVQRKANLSRYKDSTFIISEDEQSVQVILPSE